MYPKIHILNNITNTRYAIENKSLLIDSTMIRLFSDILKGVGRNSKNDGKKKGGLKGHMLIETVQSVERFIK